jgi:uncharacterized protein
MPEKYIPEHIDPYRFTEQSLHLEGAVKLADMPRLNPSLCEEGDTVLVRLHFGVDEQGINYIKGHLETRLKLQCQRCMEPYIYEIMSDFVLGIVSSLDEANALPELYEPALTKDGSLALRELIEDEIILNLPIIPRHEIETCNMTLPFRDAEWEKSDTKNPFAVLKVLKGRD